MDVPNWLLTPNKLTYKLIDNQIVLQANKQEGRFGESSTMNPLIDRLPHIQEVIAEEPISGQLTDEKGDGLPGVNVILKGQNRGKVTDVNGKFLIQGPANKGVLVFSFVGYETQEIQIDTQTSLTIRLLTSSKSLNEVVLVGYGTQSKADITGSIGQIKQEKNKGYSLSPALTRVWPGRLRGVKLTREAGAPGVSSTIQIRGVGTLTAGPIPYWSLMDFRQTILA